MKTKKAAQVAIEVLVVVGILVIGSVVLGIFYINSHNASINTIKNLQEGKDTSQAELDYEDISTHTQASCGNGLQELGETCTSCPQDYCDLSKCSMACLSCCPPCETIGSLTFITPNTPPFTNIFNYVFLDTYNNPNTTNPNPTCQDYEIHYTTNGSTPTTSSQIYNQAVGIPVTLNSPIPFVFTSTTQVKAAVYAKKPDGSQGFGTPATKTYTINLPLCTYGTFGDGTPTHPKVICTATDLFGIHNDIDAGKNLYYFLGTDIDLNSALLSSEPWYNQASGWKPINGFKGSFDGNGNSIKNLTIKNNENYQGLFGEISSSSAEIKNLKLENVNITFVNNNTGALVGSNAGKINNCSATGYISGSSTDIGGLVGSNSGVIQNSYSEVFVDCGNGSLNAINVGGLVGSNINGTIQNCYSLGEVTGNNNIGGLVGYLDRGEISYSYSTGFVKGNSQIGGFIGRATNRPVTIKYDYWDKTTSRLSTSAGGPNVIPKTTAEMKTIPHPSNIYFDWDFTTIWGHNASINSSYPFLRNNLPN